MHSDATPWYRQRWPWILMSGPAIVVVAGAITTWIAFATADTLVVDDYYRRGVSINDRLACERTESGAVRDPARCRNRALLPARREVR
jgi:hypothetical protein